MRWSLARPAPSSAARRKILYVRPPAASVPAAPKESWLGMDTHILACEEIQPTNRERKANSGNIADPYQLLPALIPERFRSSSIHRRLRWRRDCCLQAAQRTPQHETQPACFPGRLSRLCLPSNAQVAKADVIEPKPLLPP